MADEGTTPNHDIFGLTLEELVNIKVTSSTLTSKDLKVVPASITVFTGEQICNLGAEYLHELINFVPGFQSYRPGESSLEYFHSARGHRTSVSSREVLILLDGMRLNREFDNALAVPMLSLHNVEKIEFIRGPGSALYGSNAYLGVIDITTVKDRNELQLAAGENGKRQLSGLASQQIANLQFDLSLHLFTDDGEQLPLENIYTLESEKDKDPRKGKDLQLRGRLDNTTLTASYFLREADGFYVSERTSAQYNHVEHEHKSVQLQQKIDWQARYSSELRARLSESSYNPESFLGPAGFSTGSQEEDNRDVKIYNNWYYSNNQSYQFGLEYRYSDFSAFLFQSDIIGNKEFYPQLTQEVFSGYVQTQFVSDLGHEVVVGLRYDRHNRSGSSISPRFGIVVPLSPNQTAKFLYGEAFRAPTVNELYLDTFPGDVQGNPDLDAERIKTWEAIWFGHWKKFSITLNGFYNVMEDTIVRTDTNNGATFSNLDGDESYYGFEIEYAFQFNDSWLVKANASNFKNLPAADFRESQWLASLIVNYHYERWNFSLSNTYADERDMLVDRAELSPDPYRVTLDSYWQFQSKIQYSLNKNFNIYLTGKNLLDDGYDTPPQRAEHGMPFPNRGRELTLGTNIYF